MDRARCTICGSTICGSTILAGTHHANGGLCAQCAKIPPAKRALAATVKAEANPLRRAIELYSALVDKLVAESTHRHFGAIGDPILEGVRFYTIERLSGSFNCDETVELASENVDEIEAYLSQAEAGYTLLHPMLAKLITVAPAFNANGRTVFLGTWGMGPGEIGWMIRRINDRKTFDRYLQSVGIPEERVDAYQVAFEQDLNHAEQKILATGVPPAPDP
jgi:hypothetical protein